MKYDINITSETGRSMVEMLGVLAIIGVLSIGGIQGYTYAMNKYRANNILNELNIASHQLATVLLSKRVEELTLSLDSNYDEGKMSSAEYPFNYGCGKNPDIEEECYTDETGYWFTLDNVPVNICKNMMLSAPQLPFWFEQKVNDEIDTQGEQCQQENNHIALVFDVAEEAGITVSDEEDIPLCPDSTSMDGEGGLAVVLNDKSQTKCYCTEINTVYSDGLCITKPYRCVTNSDCNRGEYCSIISYNSSTYEPISGTCKDAASIIKAPNPNTNPPFIVSEYINWWSVQNFCKALGKTNVVISDFGCKHTVCASGCNSTWGYCHNPDATHSVTTNVSADRSDVMKEMTKAYGAYYGYLGMDYNYSNGYYVGFHNGVMNKNHPKNYIGAAVCK